MHISSSSHIALQQLARVTSRYSPSSISLYPFIITCCRVTSGDSLFPVSVYGSSLFSILFGCLLSSLVVLYLVWLFSILFGCSLSWLVVLYLVWLFSILVGCSLFAIIISVLCYLLLFYLSSSILLSIIIYPFFAIFFSRVVSSFSLFSIITQQATHTHTHTHSLSLSLSLSLQRRHGSAKVCGNGHGQPGARRHLSPSPPCPGTYPPAHPPAHPPAPTPTERTHARTLARSHAHVLVWRYGDWA